MSLSPQSASSSSSTSTASSTLGVVQPPTNNPQDTPQPQHFNTDTPPIIITRETLADFKVPELKNYCRQLGLPTSGTKQTLIDRLDARLNQSILQQQHLHQSHPHHHNLYHNHPSTLHQHENSLQSYTLAGGITHHSSAALFFSSETSCSSNFMSPQPDNNDGTFPSKNNHLQGNNNNNDEDDDVITISSSASSPGICHDGEGFQWSTNGHHMLHNDQLMKLHSRVESQQRRIEQLKAELFMERSKQTRLDESNFPDPTNQDQCNGSSLDVSHFSFFFLFFSKRFISSLSFRFGIMNQIHTMLTVNDAINEKIPSVQWK